MGHFRKNKSLTSQVEALKRAKFASSEVVELAAYRQLAEKRAHKPKILVVDDDEIVRRGLKRVLEGAHYHVLVASDGMELAKTLESTTLDLILLDIKLPWVDGLELCELIKTNDYLKQVPVILMSGDAGTEVVERAFKVGCDEFLPKPFQMETLLSLVARCYQARAAHLTT